MCKSHHQNPAYLIFINTKRWIIIPSSGKKYIFASKNTLTMKHTLILLFSVLFSFTPVDAQKRVIDATDHSPISTASILDAAGNMVGFTWSDGVFTEIPETAYPITIRCMGYEQLVIERPEEKTWEMIPMVYELEDVVIFPVKRNILKQTFYVREYFSMNTENDTITSFMEHMAVRFVPASKNAEFKGNTSLRVLDSKHYLRYNVSGKDSISADSQKSTFPSMLSVLELSEDEVVAPESFKSKGNTNKLYEKQGKSGMSLIQRQNGQTFTVIEDMLARKKEHKHSPLLLKAIGFTMDFKQLYTTQTYRTNDNGVYMPKDLIEAGFVMEADGRGKYLRKALKSDKPVEIRSMIELYVVECDYLSKEEAKEQYKNRPDSVEFVIPSSVPPLNEATRRLVERSNAHE